MKPSDKPAFLATLTGLAAIKPGKPLTPEGLEVFWQAMQRWSIENFKQAAGHLARTIEFMPNPFHFEELRKAARPTAGEAWARALDWAASSNYRDCSSIGDPLIDAAVRAIGGYVAIAMSDEDKTHYLERRFCEHFESLQDAEDTREAVPQIAGGAQHGRLGRAVSAREIMANVALEKAASQ